MLDERKRLQNPDDLADAKLDSDTLIRIARRAGLDPDSDLPEEKQTLGELHRRAQQIFASEGRSTDATAPSINPCLTIGSTMKMIRCL